MDCLLFFDANAYIGQPVFDPQVGAHTRYAGRHDLLSAMDYYGVDYALVSPYRSLFGNPMRGNSLLVEEIGDSQRLFPCWTLLPGHSGEVPQGRELPAVLRKHRVKAVRLVLGPYYQIFTEWVFQDLFRVLERERILTILQFPTLGVPVPEKEDFYFDRLDEVCRRYSKLPIVTCGRLRGFYPLMERHENLYASLAWDPHPDFVEDICRRFGSRRVLFATPYSENAREISGMPMLMVTHADISPADKARIAGRNLAELLGLELKSLPELEGKKQFNELLQGKPAEQRIIDIHAHAGPWNWEHKPSSGLEGLLRCMDRLGVEKVCVNSTEAVLGGDHLKGNEELATEISRYKGRFIGFAVINPHFADLPDYIRKCVEELGYRGIKMHPRAHRCAITDPKCRHVWEASVKYGIPILCHTGEGQAFSEPNQFERIAQEHPQGKFILGHTGETFAGMLQCIELANKHQNLYLDISGWGFMNRGYLEYLARRVDVRRILFGSDYSWIDLRYAAATVLFARISEIEKNMILSANSRAVLNLKE